MGAVASCCTRANKDEKVIEAKDYYFYTSKNNKKKTRNNYYKNNNSLNIKNIIVSESSINNNNDYDKDIINHSINSEKYYDIEKIRTIQKNYRSHLIQNKFINEIKPSIERKTTDYINQFYKQCSLGGQILTEEDDYSEDGWKKYYPPNERFFLYSKGEVFQNQIRLNNKDDPENLEIYEGETNFENLKHGFGILTTPSYILKGSWRKGEFTGWGKKYFRNGDVLEGKFLNGELNGKGIFKNKNNIYVGDFINGKRCGKGDLTTEKYHYKGDFKNNKFEGYGIIEFLIEGHRYEGYFENNEINGKGIYKWKNGDIYEGEMKNGKMNGKGKYSYIDGKIYEGEYLEGIKEGKGKLTYPDGKSFDGYFENGLPEGEGLYTKNGNIYKVLFSKGEYIKCIFE